MPLATTHRPTAANLIVPDWLQRENDGSASKANETIPLGRPPEVPIYQANGVIGDGPFGTTSGDFDVFKVVAYNYLNVDVDAQTLGSALNAAIDVYNSAGVMIASVDNDPEGGADPYLFLDGGVPQDTYTIVIRAAGSALTNLNVASSGTGATSTGAYRVFISNYKPITN